MAGFGGLASEADGQPQRIDRHVERFLSPSFEEATGAEGSIGAKALAADPALFHPQGEKAG